MTDEEKAALDLFLAFETQHHDHFSIKLFRLFSKADSMNERRLAQAYPVHGAIYFEWMASPTVQAFYDKYNVRGNYNREKADPPKTMYIPDAPITDDLNEVMNDIATILNDAIKKHAPNQGFALLIFDIGEGGNMNYISNAERGSMLEAMQEFIDKHQ